MGVATAGRIGVDSFDSAAFKLAVPVAAAVAASGGEETTAAMLLGWLDQFVEAQTFVHHPVS